MIHVSDLHIRQEVLPLFDFTHNDFAKETLIDLLQKPLPSTDKILSRQKILKAFVANLELIKNNPYSRIDLYEVHTFLSKHARTKTLQSNLRWRLLKSKSERHRARSGYIQVILLFHRLSSNYFKKINISSFPENYRNELQKINDFFSDFDLNDHIGLIQKQKFKINHIIRLKNMISEKTDKGELKAFWERCFLFEAYLSIAEGITGHGLCFPTFNEKHFSFEDLYHPSLTQPVKNSFASNGNVILLTGPNMSGKSTFLKAAGIAVYLGHTGLAVPASKAEMPFFESISVTIDLHDDLLSGYSHFMSEIMNLKATVIDAVNHKKCFAIFDELFRGTNIGDAVKISAATIRGLARFKDCIFLISTHLHQLKELGDIQWEALSTYYFDCRLTGHTPEFNYRLEKGWSDLKLGEILFEKEGLNKLLDPHG